MKAFNLLRYIVALVVLIWSFFLPPVVTVFVILVLLAINNCLDDVVFYHGSKQIDRDKYSGGVACPVNGVVTCIENDVPLMSHIRKCDYLEDKILLELDKEEKADKGKLYNHITIFLNKFNCHAVTNIGSKIVREVYYDKDGVMISMVEAGEMITKLDGHFLNNSFIRTEYENGVICVYTLDKYVSKMIASDTHELLGVDYFICRGSQCDIYIPREMEFCVKKNQILRNLQTISKGAMVNTVIDYPAEAGALIAKDSCSHAGHIILSNLKKTISTYSFRNPVVLFLLLVAIVLGAIPGLLPIHGNLFALIVIEFFTGLFALDRFFKNLLYAFFNIAGFKPGLAKFYKWVHYRL
ncbi:MAG: hypothetical protein IK009_06735 [Bacteroidales bacterium]|nr:hypothetical protein [Bacteroidales bacterium]